jgi:hypothetical protein
MHMINMASSIGYPVQPGKDNACKRSPCRNAQAAQTAKKVLEASQTSRCAREVWLASNNRKRTLQKALPKYGLRKPTPLYLARLHELERRLRPAHPALVLVANPTALTHAGTPLQTMQTPTSRDGKPSCTQGRKRYTPDGTDTRHNSLREDLRELCCVANEDRRVTEYRRSRQGSRVEIGE